MKLFLKIITLIIIAIMCFSCENDENSQDSEKEGEQAQIEQDFEVVKIASAKLRSLGSNEAEDEYALKFKNDDSYNKVLGQLEEMTHNERLEWVNMLNFPSAAEEYEKAMEEAESFYDREGGYEEFKEKYPNLYFPEEGEDFGSYIPFENDLLALCANENGRLVIGDDIVNLETINDYDQLIASGRGMFDEEASDIDPDLPPHDKNVLTRSSYGVPTKLELQNRNRIEAVYLTPGHWWFEKEVIGDKRYRHSTGWRQYGNRKIKLNFNRETRRNYWLLVLEGGFRLEWHYEVSFRKKGFLGGWYNYSSKTETKCFIEYYNEDGHFLPNTQKMDYTKTGTSSHDKWAEALVFRYIEPARGGNWKNLYDYYSKKQLSYKRCLYLMPGYWATFTINYRGIPQTLRFAFAAPPLYGWTEYNTDKLGYKGPI